MDRTTDRQHASHHRIQARLYHERAQRHRKAAIAAKERRDWLAKLHHDSEANEMRRLRDQSKAIAKDYAR